MKINIPFSNNNIWSFIIWPPIIFNIGTFIIFAGLYIFKYGKPEHGQSVNFDYGQSQFILSTFIFIVEWIIFGFIYKSYSESDIPFISLFLKTKYIYNFKLLPALIIFFSLNIIFVLYIAFIKFKIPDLNYHSMNIFQSTLLIVLTPATAAFTEEIIWRGHILNKLKSIGKSNFSAIIISSVSFSLIHGIFLPDKLLITFLFGIITGYYYVRERNLFVLIFTHWFIDFWSFGYFFLR